jgi:hypothetical protein
MSSGPGIAPGRWFAGGDVTGDVGGGLGATVGKRTALKSASVCQPDCARATTTASRREKQSFRRVYTELT